MAPRTDLQLSAGAAPPTGAQPAAAGSEPAGALVAGRSAVLARIVRGEPPGDVLSAVVQFVQHQLGGRAVAVLACPPQRPAGAATVVEPTSAPASTPPPELLTALQQLATGNAGRVLAPSDLLTDPRSTNCRDAARRAGIGACWSVAIPPRNAPGNGDEAAPAGALAVCLSEPTSLAPADAELLNDAALLAALAFERAALRDQLARQAQTLAEHEQALAEQGAALAEQGVALAYRALHDPLTGLPNRDLLEDRTRQALLRATRDGRGAAVFLIETEGLRLINETLGHAAGDELLKEIATRLQATARQTDLLARTGGDEFMFVAADLKDRHGATVVAQKLLGVLTRPFNSGGRELFLNPSVGVALYPQDGGDLADLRRNADAALARARDRGRNRFEFFVPEMNDAGALERLEMEGQLRLAVERGELQLHYQPQVDGQGRIVAAEALLRWTHPKLGPVSPGKFIPIAESGGLIVPIGRWVLREVCRQAAAWRRDAALPPIRIAANVSALQFAEADFIESVEATLRACDLDPRWIELEITESALMDKPEAVADKLARLRNMGVGVAIDDFGTGYSSLAYLHRLPIDTLKIDRSFVLAIGGATEPAAATAPKTSLPPAGQPASAGVLPAAPTRATGGQAVILAVISLARSLGMNVLAEGVETAAQRDFLVHHGCHLMQGYLFSRPKPPAEVEALLRAAAPHAKPTLAA